jgi:hypothetical protein
MVMSATLALESQTQHSAVGPLIHIKRIAKLRMYFLNSSLQLVVPFAMPLAAPSIQVSVIFCIRSNARVEVEALLQG